MAKVRSVDKKASPLLVGDGNAHHEEWLGSSTTTLLGRAARDFASSSGCEQMVKKPKHIDRIVSALVVTDVPDLVKVWVGSPVGISDHRTVFKNVVLQQVFPHLVCS